MAYNGQQQMGQQQMGQQSIAQPQMGQSQMGHAAAQPPPVRQGGNHVGNQIPPQGGVTHSLFRSSVADQVKRGLKPYYQKATINKDHSKLIIKKVVEKLVVAHGDKVQDNHQAVGAFLTAVRIGKIQKMVDGYIQCYAVKAPGQ